MMATKKPAAGISLFPAAGLFYSMPPFPAASVFIPIVA